MPDADVFNMKIGEYLTLLPCCSAATLAVGFPSAPPASGPSLPLTYCLHFACFCFCLMFRAENTCELE